MHSVLKTIYALVVTGAFLFLMVLVIAIGTEVVKEVVVVQIFAFLVLTLLVVPTCMLYHAWVNDIFNRR